MKEKWRAREEVGEEVGEGRVEDLGREGEREMGGGGGNRRVRGAELTFA